MNRQLLLNQYIETLILSSFFTTLLSSKYTKSVVISKSDKNQTNAPNVTVQVKQIKYRIQWKNSLFQTDIRNTFQFH